MSLGILLASYDLVCGETLLESYYCSSLFCHALHAFYFVYSVLYDSLIINVYFCFSFRCLLPTLPPVPHPVSPTPQSSQDPWEKTGRFFESWTKDSLGLVDDHFLAQRLHPSWWAARLVTGAVFVVWAICGWLLFAVAVAVVADSLMLCPIVVGMDNYQDSCLGTIVVVGSLHDITVGDPRTPGRNDHQIEGDHAGHGSVLKRHRSYSYYLYFR